MKKRLFISLGIFLVSLVLLIVFGILVSNSGGKPLAGDIWARDLAYSVRGEKGGLNYWFWRLITEFGDIIFLVILTVALFLYTRMDYRFLIFVAGVLLEVLLNYVFKGIFQRPRPLEEYWWVKESSTSFPSGHSTATGFVYPFLIFFVLTTEKNKKIKIPVLVASSIFVLLIPISRIVLGVHYLSDCIGGLALGGCVSSIAMAMLVLFKEYNILPEGVFPFFKKKNKLEEKEENTEEVE